MKRACVHDLQLCYLFSFFLFAPPDAMLLQSKDRSGGGYLKFVLLLLEKYNVGVETCDT